MWWAVDVGEHTRKFARGIGQVAEPVTLRRRSARSCKIAIFGSKSTAGALRQMLRGTAPCDLKQDAGGIVDIEVMVQYAGLEWSQAIRIAAHTTISAYEGLESRVMPDEDASLLREPLRAYAPPIPEACRRMPACNGRPFGMNDGVSGSARAGLDEPERIQREGLLAKAECQSPFIWM